MKAPFALKPTWWLNPVVTVLITFIPFVISAHLMAEGDYLEFWGTQKYLGLDTAVLLGSIILAFCIGMVCDGLIRRKRAPLEIDLDLKKLRLLFTFSFIATVLGYATWAAVCYLQGVGPAQVLAVLRNVPGAAFDIRHLGTTIPGLTTVTQCGMATVILGGLIWNRQPTKLVALMLGVVILMAMVRALVWSERLAVIEVVIPLFLTLFGRRAWGARSMLGGTMRFLPLLGAIGLYLFFTFAEYFRSWDHYSTSGISIWYFSWIRLCGYYITALNNGALMYKELGILPFPYMTFETFWKFPGVSLLLPYNDLFSVDPDAYADSLKAMANPEFTNGSGIFPYVADFGPIGGCFFWFVVGWIATRLYSAYVRGTLSGLLLYPLLYTGFLEICRVCYLTSARTLPSWGVLIVAYFVLKRKRRSVARVEPYINHEATEIRNHFLAEANAPSSVGR